MLSKCFDSMGDDKKKTWIVTNVFELYYNTTHAIETSVGVVKNPKLHVIGSNLSILYIFRLLLGGERN